MTICRWHESTWRKSYRNIYCPDSSSNYRLVLFFLSNHYFSSFSLSLKFIFLFLVKLKSNLSFLPTPQSDPIICNISRLYHKDSSLANSPLLNSFWYGLRSYPNFYITDNWFSKTTKVFFHTIHIRWFFLWS